MARAAWAQMREARYGRIVFITSSHGLYGAFGQANYSSAKSALVGLTKTLAKEGASRGILVNCLAPGAGTSPNPTRPPTPGDTPSWGVRAPAGGGASPDGNAQQSLRVERALPTPKLRGEEKRKGGTGK